MLVSVVLTIVCHVCFVVCPFLTDCCCHCCIFQLRFARRQFEVQPVRDVLPPFLSLIVCDLISDGGAYLQFAGRCLPTSSGSRVPPLPIFAKMPPSLLLANCLLALVVGSLPSLHLLKCLLALVPPLHLVKCLPGATADAQVHAYLWYYRMSAHILCVYLEHIHFAGFQYSWSSFV